MSDAVSRPSDRSGHRARAAPRAVTVIGGGTGSFNVLVGLRPYEHLQLHLDRHHDRLRRRLGPAARPSSRCCRRETSAAAWWRCRTRARCCASCSTFASTTIRCAGRQLGNLLVLALTRILGSEREAINAIHRLLNIRGRVLPVSWDQVHLCAELADGQHHRGRGPHRRPQTRPLHPHPPGLPAARGRRPTPRPWPPSPRATSSCWPPAISTPRPCPTCWCAACPRPCAARRAKLIYVLNLMTKRGETLGYPASRHVEEMIRYGGRVPDAVLVHRGDVPAEMAAALPGRGGPRRSRSTRPRSAPWASR